MISVQVVPRHGINAYQLLRDKVTHEARTWSWSNKARTRLIHSGNKRMGYVEVTDADSILVAEVRPRTKADEFFLLEKFIGRLTAWFAEDLYAINLQFPEWNGQQRKRKR